MVTAKKKELIASKLFRVSKESAVYKLVLSLENAARENGHTMSRWQANKGGRAVTVSYAIHSGDRAAQFRYQPEDSIIACTVMSQAEGSTERCEAYQKLRGMEAEFDQHMIQEAAL